MPNASATPRAMGRHQMAAAALVKICVRAMVIAPIRATGSGRAAGRPAGRTAAAPAPGPHPPRPCQPFGHQCGRARRFQRGAQRQHAADGDDGTPVDGPVGVLDAQAAAEHHGHGAQGGGQRHVQAAGGRQPDGAAEMAAAGRPGCSRAPGFPRAPAAEVGVGPSRRMCSCGPRSSRCRRIAAAPGPGLPDGFAVAANTDDGQSITMVKIQFPAAFCPRGGAGGQRASAEADVPCRCRRGPDGCFSSARRCTCLARWRPGASCPGALPASSARASGRAAGHRPPAGSRPAPRRPPFPGGRRPRAGAPPAPSGPARP